jgi:hypothetical protein
LWNRSRKEVQKEGIRSIPITNKVHNQSGERKVQENTNRSVSAAGTRLRRKLSKIFQRESPDSGFR